MALYEITLEQQYHGQQIINRWNYLADSIPAGVSGAFKALVGMGFAPDTDIEPFGPETIAYNLQGIQTVSAVFVQAIAKNLYSVTDFYTYAFPPNTTGANNTGQGLSPVMAFGFTSDRTRSDIRRAQKRFVGVGENYTDEGGVIPSAARAGIQALGDAMADINVVPAGAGAITFTPYVFGREKYHPTGKTTWAYKYYDTEAEQLDHIAKITAFTLKEDVRTQNSRQYGRGS
jgi:hypothetical protein